MVWYTHVFQNFPQFIVIHTVKGFGIINKAEIDVFLELSCFFDDPVNVGNLISGSSAFSKTSLNNWKFTVHILLKPGLENFEYYFTSVWDECNCAVVWTFFGIAFLWDWNENWPFPVLWPLLSFPNMLAYWVQNLHSIIFRILNTSTVIPSPPLALFVVMLPQAHLTSHSRMSDSVWLITRSWLSASLTLLVFALTHFYFKTKFACFFRYLFSSVQSLSCTQLFGTPRTAACQASLSITNSRSLPKLMSIELVMPSKHLICYFSTDLQ